MLGLKHVCVRNDSVLEQVYVSNGCVKKEVTR